MPPISLMLSLHHARRLVCHGENYRVEIYWTCAQPKVGVRKKDDGKSMFCHSFRSFTILILLANEMAASLQYEVN